MVETLQRQTIIEGRIRKSARILENKTPASRRQTVARYGPSWAGGRSSGERVQVAGVD